METSEDVPEGALSSWEDGAGCAGTWTEVRDDKLACAALQIRRLTRERDEARAAARDAQSELLLVQVGCDEALAEVERLREAGRALACCAFNLKQREHLTDRERRSLTESQEAWDRAVRGDRG